jgi:hypothetical protein
VIDYIPQDEFVKQLQYNAAQVDARKPPSARVNTPVPAASLSLGAWFFQAPDDVLAFAFCFNGHGAPPHT